MHEIKAWGLALGLGLLVVLTFYVVLFLSLAITGDYTGGFRAVTGLEEDSAVVDIVLDIHDAAH